MKLLSFIDPAGKPTYGLYNDQGGVIDLGRRLGSTYPDLKSLITHGAYAEAAAYANAEADYPEAEITYLPVIPNPGKIICGGMNYSDKRQEFAQTHDAPTLFVRFPESQAAHKQPLLKPAESKEFDYECELAVVIGKGGRRISQADALAHVAGYSCYMDGSMRDWQFTWFTAAKNWPQTGAFGPWMVTTDDIPDPQQMTIATYLNGKQMQGDHTRNMIYTVPFLVSYISTFMALSAGDVIITGSPGGVGKKRNPPVFMHHGDVVEVEIEKIGRLVNTIQDE